MRRKEKGGFGVIGQLLPKMQDTCAVADTLHVTTGLTHMHLMGNPKGRRPIWWRQQRG